MPTRPLQTESKPICYIPDSNNKLQPVYKEDIKTVYTAGSETITVKHGQ